jgi:hypothetical protein
MSNQIAGSSTVAFYRNANVAPAGGHAVGTRHKGGKRAISGTTFARLFGEKN